MKVDEEAAVQQELLDHYKKLQQKENQDKLEYPNPKNLKPNINTFNNKREKIKDKRENKTIKKLIGNIVETMGNIIDGEESENHSHEYKEQYRTPLRTIEQPCNLDNNGLPTIEGHVNAPILNFDQRNINHQQHGNTNVIKINPSQNLNTQNTQYNQNNQHSNNINLNHGINRGNQNVAVVNGNQKQIKHDQNITGTANIAKQPRIPQYARNGLPQVATTQHKQQEYLNQQIQPTYYQQQQYTPSQQHFHQNQQPQQCQPPQYPPQQYQPPKQNETPQKQNETPQKQQFNGKSSLFSPSHVIKSMQSFAGGNPKYFQKVLLHANNQFSYGGTNSCTYCSIEAAIYALDGRINPEEVPDDVTKTLVDDILRSGVSMDLEVGVRSTDEVIPLVPRFKKHVPQPWICLGQLIIRDSFECALIQMEQRTIDLKKTSCCAILTKPPESIMIFYRQSTAETPITYPYIIFDSHPRSWHQHKGAGFYCFTSRGDAVCHLKRLYKPVFEMVPTNEKTYEQIKYDMFELNVLCNLENMPVKYIVPPMKTVSERRKEAAEKALLLQSSRLTHVAHMSVPSSNAAYSPSDPLLSCSLSQFSPSQAKKSTRDNGPLPAPPVVGSPKSSQDYEPLPLPNESEEYDSREDMIETIKTLKSELSAAQNKIARLEAQLNQRNLS